MTKPHPQNLEITHMLQQYNQVILRASDGSHIIVINARSNGALSIHTLFQPGVKLKGVPFVQKWFDGES